MPRLLDGDTRPTVACALQRVDTSRLQVSIQRLEVTPCHGVRAGLGLDAFVIRAVGFGVITGDLGRFRVRARFERIVLRRLERTTFAVSFWGLHGRVRVTVTMAATGRLARLQVSPAIEFVPPPNLTVPAALTTYSVHLPPVTEGHS